MSNTYKLGIVGYGGMATWHHQNMDRAPQVIPYAVYDIDPERTAIGAERGLKPYDSLDAILADEDIDIILLTCPNNFHAEYSIRAMRAGKNVICEKPVTMNSDELIEVIRAKQETGMHFSVHQNRRWDGDYLTVKNVLSQGILGEPFVIRSKVLGSRGVPEGWRTHKETGGGMMLDWGVHLLDQIVMMIPENIVRVTSRMYHTSYEEVDDGFIADFEFESGLVASVEVDTVAFVNEPRWIVRGDSGSMIIENWDIDGKIVRAADKNTVWEDEILYTSAGPTKTMAPRTRFSEETLELPVVKADWMEFYHNFAAVLDGTEEPLVLPGQNLYIMKLMESCFRSSDERRTIELDFTLEQLVQDPLSVAKSVEV